MRSSKKSWQGHNHIVTCGQVSLRADLFYFLDYLDGNFVELTKREKTIPTPVVRKMNKLMTRFSAGELQDADGDWVSFLSYLARQMGFVSFDTSDRDRYDYDNTYYDRSLRRRVRIYREEDLGLNEARYQQYLASSDLDKETQIVHGLCQYLGNEFYQVNPLARSQDYASRRGVRFDTFGSAIGAGGHMDLPKVRKALLSILGELDPDIWYDFGDFVQDIKQNHDNLILDHKRRDRYNRDNFYYTFKEYQSPEGRYHAHSSSREINQNMADAFERVEGRYLAYFLEAIPCLMGYVSLAKVSPENTKEAFPFPEYNTIKGFCLTPKGKAVLTNDRSYGFHREFKLLPNYDIHLHMPDFSETIVTTLEKIAPLKREGLVYAGKLNREMFCQAMLQGEEFEDYLSFFRDLGSLPQNVEVELQSWVSHTEKVVIYQDGVYLESLADLDKIKQEKEISAYIVGETPRGLILHEGEKVLNLCLEKGYSPLANRRARPSVQFISDDECLVPFSGRDPLLVHTLSKIGEKARETAEGEVYRIIPEKIDAWEQGKEAFLEFWQRSLPPLPPSRRKKFFPQLQDEPKTSTKAAAKPLKMIPYIRIELPDQETHEKLKSYLTRQEIEFIAIDQSAILVRSEVKKAIVKGDWR